MPNYTIEQLAEMRKKLLNGDFPFDSSTTITGHAINLIADILEARRQCDAWRQAVDDSGIYCTYSNPRWIYHRQLVNLAAAEAEAK